MRNGRPLVELHRHLDGNVRLETVVDLARRHRVELPALDAEGLRPFVQVTEREPDLMAFIAKFECLRRVFVDYEAVRRIARENVEDAAREGIDYIELRFSPYFMAERHGLEPARVVEAVCDGVDEALSVESSEAGKRTASLPPRARLIGIISRHYGPEVGWIELEAALAFRHRGVVALDLAGDEARFPGELFVEHFRHARAEGLHVIAHAGEADGAASVRQAIEGLGAERIGHGVRCVEDPALVDLIVERGIPLEVCPTSNVQTSTVESFAAHPLPYLLERGVKANLNTDDPSISGIDLAHEYRVAEEKLGLGEDELGVLQRNGLEAAFLSEGERAALEALAEAWPPPRTTPRRTHP